MDLQPFCSVDETRMAINTPFVFNGWKFTFDGGEGLFMPVRKEAE
jgi:hypothetical protein